MKTKEYEMETFNRDTCEPGADPNSSISAATGTAIAVTSGRSSRVHSSSSSSSGSGALASASSGGPFRFDTATQCTTQSVFYHIEQVSFIMTQKYLLDGNIKLGGKITKNENLIRAELAPPLSFYTKEVSLQLAAASASPAAPATITAGVAASAATPIVPSLASVPINDDDDYDDSGDYAGYDAEAGDDPWGGAAAVCSRSVFVREFLENFRGLTQECLDRTPLRPVAIRDARAATSAAASSFSTTTASSVASAAASAAFTPCRGNCTLNLEQSIDWPKESNLRELEVVQQQKKAFSEIKMHIFRFIDADIAPTLRSYVSYPAPQQDDGAGVLSGCFTKARSPFHRIDRFPKLCEALKMEAEVKISCCIEKARKEVLGYLQHQWKYGVPHGLSGQDLASIYHQLSGVFCRAMFLSLLEWSPLTDGGNTVDIDDSLFIEAEAFANRRRELHHEWKHLQQQHAILEKCLTTTNNEQLRELLQQAEKAHDGQDTPLEDGTQRQQDDGDWKADALHWTDFWKKVQLIHGQCS